MHFSHQSESMDSLLAWSPFECERKKYAQRYYLSTDAKQRKFQPMLLDRTELDRTFRRLAGNQSTECKKKLAETTDGYRAKDTRPEIAIEVQFGTKLQNKSCEMADYKVQIIKEYKTFEREFIALRVDTMRMLSCNGGPRTDNGWILIADRVQEYLSRVRKFFDSKLSHINSMESTWTLRNRTLALEALNKLYTSDVSWMDDFIETVVEV